MLRLKRLTDIDRDLRVVQRTLYIVCINMKTLETVTYAAFLWLGIPSVHERLFSSIFKRTFESWKKSRDPRVVTNGSGSSFPREMVVRRKNVITVVY